MAVDAKKLADALGIAHIHATNLEDNVVNNIFETLRKAGFKKDSLLAQVKRFVERWLGAVAERAPASNSLDKTRITRIINNRDYSPATLGVLLDQALSSYLDQDDFLKKDIAAAATGKGPSAEAPKPTGGDKYSAKIVVTPAFTGVMSSVLSRALSTLTTAINAELKTGIMDFVTFDKLLHKVAAQMSDDSAKIWDSVIDEWAKRGERRAQIVDALIKLANELDDRGFSKEADAIDDILRKGV